MKAIDIKNGVVEIIDNSELSKMAKSDSELMNVLETLKTEVSNYIEDCDYKKEGEESEDSNSEEMPEERPMDKEMPGKEKGIDMSIYIAKRGQMKK